MCSSDLLRDVLEVELKRKALRHATLHLAAGSSAEKTGQTLGAIGHYLLAHREDLVLQLLQRLAPAMYKRTEFVPLIGLLESLPTTMLPKDLLEMLGGALIETGQHARGEVILRSLRAKKQLSLDGLWMLGPNLEAVVTPSLRGALAGNA